MQTTITSMSNSENAKIFTSSFIFLLCMVCKPKVPKWAKRTSNLPPDHDQQANGCRSMKAPRATNPEKIQLNERS